MTHRGAVYQDETDWDLKRAKPSGIFSLSNFVSKRACSGRLSTINQPRVDITAETRQREISTRTHYQIQPDNTRCSIDGTDFNVGGRTTMVAGCSFLVLSNIPYYLHRGGLSQRIDRHKQPCVRSPTGEGIQRHASDWGC